MFTNNFKLQMVMFVVFWVSVTFTVRFELKQMKKKQIKEIKKIYMYILIVKMVALILSEK